MAKRTAYPRTHVRFRSLSEARTAAVLRAQAHAQWSAEDDRAEYALGRMSDADLNECQQLTATSYALGRLLLGIDE